MGVAGELIDQLQPYAEDKPGIWETFMKHNEGGKYFAHIGEE